MLSPDRARGGGFFGTIWGWIWSQAWLVLVVMAVVFGANGAVARLAVGQVSPLVLVLLRWLFVLPLLGSVFTREDWRAVGALLRDRPVLLGWMGLLGFSGFNALFYIAAYHTTAINLTLLQSSIPAFVLAGSALVFRTAVRARQVAGMTLTLIGVLLVAAHGDVSRLSALRFNGGDLLLLVACLFYAVYTLGLRTRPPGAPLVFFAGAAVASALWSLPMALGEVATGRSYWPSWQGWLLTLFTAAGPSFGAQLCYMRGVDLIGPARAGLFMNLTPIFGALAAVLILHEHFTLAHAVAVALGLGGISLAEWAGPVSRARRSDGRRGPATGR